MKDLKTAIFSSTRKKQGAHPVPFADLLQILALSAYRSDASVGAFNGSAPRDPPACRNLTVFDAEGHAGCDVKAMAGVGECEFRGSIHCGSKRHTGRNVKAVTGHN